MESPPPPPGMLALDPPREDEPADEDAPADDELPALDPLSPPRGAADPLLLPVVLGREPA